MKLLVLVLGLSLILALTSARRPAPAPADVPTLELVALSPAAGSRLQAGGTIRAQLLYSLPDADSARYIVYTQFPTSLAPGVQTSGSVRPVQLPKGRKVGTVTLPLPLRQVWTDPVIRHPLTCYYFLARRSSPAYIDIVAHVGPFAFME